VALSADGQRGVLSTLFSARTLGLTGELAPDQQPDYLSGLLIGHELAGLPGAAKHKPIILIGARRSVPVTNAPSDFAASPTSAWRKRPPNAASGNWRWPPGSLNLQRRPDMLKQALAQNGLIAILRGVRPDEARRSAKSCTAGFRVIEVPLNSPDPYKASASCAQPARRLPDRCRHGADAGAGRAGESRRRPGDRHAPQRCQGLARRESCGLYLSPGVATPTEAFAALAEGADVLKLFPAEQMGPAVIKAWLAVLPAGTLLLPVGGITRTTCRCSSTPAPKGSASVPGCSNRA
jgi:2-dehydro-3-deoxyphosphogalactonate aldolase